MEKVYKASIFTLLINVIMLGVAVLVVFFIASIFLKLYIAIAIAGFLALLALAYLFSLSRLRIVIHDGQLSIYKGSKEYHYALDKIHLRYEIINHTTFTLYITDESGQEKDFDLSLLGNMRFQRLLNELNYAGSENNPIKITAHKKDDQ